MKDGFAIVERVLDLDEVECLRAALASVPGVQRRGVTFGIRDLLRIPEVRAIAVDPRVRRGEFAVRATFFDKQPGANWNVAWHQDSVIAVRRRCDVPGFGPWSVKGDVVQAQPPASVMAGMVAVRLHLDDCPADNGALRVLPGSRERGWLDDEIDAWRARVDPVVCAVPAGGAVVMKPLLLHASSPATRPSRRRVIHIEYASAGLTGGLEWRERVG